MEQSEGSGERVREELEDGEGVEGAWVEVHCPHPLPVRFREALQPVFAYIQSIIKH